jgi:uncharacterized protein (DUF2236 family)
MIDVLSRPLRRRIVREVRGAIAGSTDGSAIIGSSDDAYFPPDSIVRRVHGDVTTMMVGGISALLLQMLHPAVLAGVWDHSNFRADMHGRLHRTARFIAVTTYAARRDADRAIARVRAIHQQVSGHLPDGTPYRASDPALLAWVHVTEAISFFEAWRRYGRERPSLEDEARYFADFAHIAEMLGANVPPRSRVEADAFVAAMRPALCFDARTRTVGRMVTRPRLKTPVMMPAQMIATQAAIDLLPTWARRMHRFTGAGAARPLVRASTLGLAGTLRWAFA